MSVPLVSIVTPCFNAAPFLMETWESIRNQTYMRWEWIVADDASQDDSLAILHQIAAADPRVRIICAAHREPRGAAAGRNAATEFAQGSLLAFQDADDLWVPEKLEKQVEHLQEHPDAAAVCSWYSVFGTSERVATWSKMLWRYDSSVVTVEQLLNQVPATPTVLMRRSIYQQLGGMRVSPMLRTGEDKEFFLRLGLQYEVRRICQELTRVRLHPIGSSLSTTDLPRLEHRERAIIQSLKDAGVLTDRLEKQMIAHLYYTLAKEALFHYDGPFRRNLLRSVATLHAPTKAWLMALLSVLPRQLLKTVLFQLLQARNPRVSPPPFE